SLGAAERTGDVMNAVTPPDQHDQPAIRPRQDARRTFESAKRSLRAFVGAAEPTGDVINDATPPAPEQDRLPVFRGEDVRRTFESAKRSLRAFVGAQDQAGGAMNASTDVELKTNLPAVVQRPRWRAGDHEFLPAALEILETPPSPVRVTMLVLIC